MLKALGEWRKTRLSLQQEGKSLFLTMVEDHWRDLLWQPPLGNFFHLLATHLEGQEVPTSLASLLVHPSPDLLAYSRHPL